MKLNFAIICENAFVDEEQRLTIVQTFNSIKSNNFPAIHSKLTIVTNYILRKGERDKKYTQTIKILDPENQSIAELKTPTKREKQEKEMQFIGYFYNLPLPKAGIYKVKIYLDEEFQKELDLKVVQNR